MGAEHSLRDRVILVAEDEFLLADDLACGLKDEGAVVVGPAATIEEGVILCRKARHLDAAILDVNLRGQMVFPLANALLARGVPFVFATGYDRLVIPPQYEGVVLCEKPVEVNQVIKVLSGLLRA